ncbi:hypothetical protein WA026_000457 [Henosepilachna vigintioctopunctata]|uniref:Uncharacterized protein n=1 Tax=Henosepilachna vigintioctopunctata TaxID=420089 RepID=A0AAW1UZC0_9CUCU
MSDTAEQQCRSFLRSRYLYFLSSLCACNARCNIRMYGNTHISCVIKAIDLNFENMVVDELETPFANSTKNALLRITDIISIELDKNTELLKLE